MEADPIQTLWEEFERRYLPSFATDAQRSAMRGAFFIGAHGMYTLTANFQRQVDGVSEKEREELADRFSANVFNSFDSYFKEFFKEEECTRSH